MNQDNTTRPKLAPPNGEKKILLHVCCAPCAGELIETMLSSGLEVTIFYYNPNIYPKEEYALRLNESKKYADKKKIHFIDGGYDNDNWTKKTIGLEEEPERGKRCSVCFDYRLEKTAQYAFENGYKTFTSSLGITRWKDMDEINKCGLKAASHYEGLTYWTYNWRKQGGQERMYEIAKKEAFYQQNYCGCLYSLRDRDKWQSHQNKHS
jgi:epoxyqueuosine reductase